MPVEQFFKTRDNRANLKTFGASTPGCGYPGAGGRSNMAEPILTRITADPNIFGGKPIIRGMRISVELILSLLAQGETVATLRLGTPPTD